MKCPKCGWNNTSTFTREVYARKQDDAPVMIILVSGHCNRNGCDYQYKESYENKIQTFGYKPY